MGPVSFNTSIPESAIYNVAFYSDPVWKSSGPDNFQQANQSLWLQHNLVKKLYEEVSVSDLLAAVSKQEIRSPRTVRSVIPFSRLAKYNDFEYDEEREKLYMPSEETPHTDCAPSKPTVQGTPNDDSYEIWMTDIVNQEFKRFTSWNPETSSHATTEENVASTSSQHDGEDVSRGDQLDTFWKSEGSIWSSQCLPQCTELKTFDRKPSSTASLFPADVGLDDIPTIEQEEYPFPRFSVDTMDELKLYMKISSEEIKCLWQQESDGGESCESQTEQYNLHGSDQSDPDHSDSKVQSTKKKKMKVPWKRVSAAEAYLVSGAKVVHPRSPRSSKGKRRSPRLDAMQFPQLTTGTLNVDVPEFFPKSTKPARSFGKYFPSSCERGLEDEMFPYGNQESRRDDDVLTEPVPTATAFQTGFSSTSARSTPAHLAFEQHPVQQQSVYQQQTLQQQYQQQQQARYNVLNSRADTAFQFGSVGSNIRQLPCLLPPSAFTISISSQPVSTSGLSAVSILSQAQQTGLQRLVQDAHFTTSPTPSTPVAVTFQQNHQQIIEPPWFTQPTQQRVVINTQNINVVPQRSGCPIHVNDHTQPVTSSQGMLAHFPPLTAVGVGKKHRNDMSPRTSEAPSSVGSMASELEFVGDVKSRVGSTLKQDSSAKCAAASVCYDGESQQIFQTIPVYQHPQEFYHDSTRKRTGGGVDYANLILLTKGSTRSRHNKGRKIIGDATADSNGKQEIVDAKGDSNFESEIESNEIRNTGIEHGYSTPSNANSPRSLPTSGPREVQRDSPPSPKRYTETQSVSDDQGSEGGASTVAEDIALPPESRSPHIPSSARFSPRSNSSLPSPVGPGDHDNVTQPPSEEKQNVFQWLEKMCPVRAREFKDVEKLLEEFDTIEGDLENAIYPPHVRSNTDGKWGTDSSREKPENTDAFNFPSIGSSEAAPGTLIPKRRLYRDVLTNKYYSLDSNSALMSTFVADGAFQEDNADSKSIRGERSKSCVFVDNQLYSSTDSLDKKYAELERQAMEQYKSSDENLSEKYEELEQEALEQYLPSSQSSSNESILGDPFPNTSTPRESSNMESNYQEGYHGTNDADNDCLATSSCVTTNNECKEGKGNSDGMRHACNWAQIVKQHILSEGDKTDAHVSLLSSHSHQELGGSTKENEKVIAATKSLCSVSSSSPSGVTSAKLNISGGSGDKNISKSSTSPAKAKPLRRQIVLVSPIKRPQDIIPVETFSDAEDGPQLVVVVSSSKKDGGPLVTAIYNENERISPATSLSAEPETAQTSKDEATQEEKERDVDSSEDTPGPSTSGTATRKKRERASQGSTTSSGGGDLQLIDPNEQRTQVSHSQLPQSAETKKDLPEIAVTGEDPEAWVEENRRASFLDAETDRVKEPKLEEEIDISEMDRLGDEELNCRDYDGNNESFATTKFPPWMRPRRKMKRKKKGKKLKKKEVPRSETLKTNHIDSEGKESSEDGADEILNIPVKEASQGSQEEKERCEEERIGDEFIASAAPITTTQPAMRTSPRSDSELSVLTLEINSGPDKRGSSTSKIKYCLKAAFSPRRGRTGSDKNSQSTPLPPEVSTVLNCFGEPIEICNSSRHSSPRQSQIESIEPLLAACSNKHILTMSVSTAGETDGGTPRASPRSEQGGDIFSSATITQKTFTTRKKSCTETVIKFSATAITMNKCVDEVSDKCSSPRREPCSSSHSGSLSSRQSKENESPRSKQGSNKTVDSVAEQPEIERSEHEEQNCSESNNLTAASETNDDSSNPCSTSGVGNKDSTEDPDHQETPREVPDLNAKYCSSSGASCSEGCPVFQDSHPVTETEPQGPEELILQEPSRHVAADDNEKPSVPLKTEFDVSPRMIGDAISTTGPKPDDSSTEGTFQPSSAENPIERMGNTLDVTSKLKLGPDVTDKGINFKNIKNKAAASFKTGLSRIGQEKTATFGAGLGQPLTSLPGPSFSHHSDPSLLSPRSTRNGPTQETEMNHDDSKRFSNSPSNSQSGESVQSLPTIRLDSQEGREKEESFLIQKPQKRYSTLSSLTSRHRNRLGLSEGPAHELSRLSDKKSEKKSKTKISREKYLESSEDDMAARKTEMPCSLQ